MVLAPFLIAALLTGAPPEAPSKAPAPRSERRFSGSLKQANPGTYPPLPAYCPSMPGGFRILRRTASHAEGRAASHSLARVIV